MTLQALKKKRGSIKSRVTTFSNNLKRICESNADTNMPLSRDIVIQLKERIERHKEVFNDFNIIQAGIEEFTDDLVKVIDYRQEFEDEYFCTLAQAQELLSRGTIASNSTGRPVGTGSVGAGMHISDQLQQLIQRLADQNLAQQDLIQRNLSQQQSSPGFSAVGQSQMQNLPVEQRIPGIKLPIIDLPKFDGKLADWLGFRDTYKSLIHDSAAIGDIQKFHYLKSALSGSAGEIIEEYEFSEQNYQVVWQTLCERYDNVNLLIHHHIESIFNIPKIVKASATRLRDLIDVVNKNIRSLKKLGEPTEHWDSLLIYIVTTKLDLEGLKEWEKHRAELTSKPTIAELIKCLRERAALLQTITSKDAVGIKQAKPQKTGVFLTNKGKCVMCSKDHSIHNCEAFLKLNTKDRSNKIKELKLCINCLRGGHYATDCKSGPCKKCKLKHNSLIHFDRETKLEDSNSQKSNALCATNKALNDSLLATAKVISIGPTKMQETARAFLDSCAQSNFISERLCSRLKVIRLPVNVQLGTLSRENTILKEKCEIEIKSRHSNYGFKLQCLIVPDIIKDKVPNSKIDLHGTKIPAHIKLADQTFYTPRVVDLLIGAEWFWQLLCIGQEKLGNLIMQKTKLGWVVGGPLMPSSASPIHCNLVRRVDIQEQLTKFWELEEISETKALSIEEKSCEELFLKITRRDADGKFIVTIPLKGSVSDLGESRSQAERRLINLERKLRKNTDLREKYNVFMDEYLNLGHMSEVPNESAAKHAYYMPHHAVTKSDSETTKTLVVFDASAATSSGLSLNDLQMCGPVIQSDLFSIIIRFRKHQFIISADIEKMYRQVWIEPKQRTLQRILWRRDSEESIKAYKLNTVTYGTAAASFLAIRSLVQLAINNKDKFPNESKIILNDFYVDDLLTGGRTAEELSLTAKRINEILSGGGFKLRKWVSNSAEVLKYIIEAENCPSTVHLVKDNQGKTLGLMWNAKDDVLTYSINLPACIKITKRHILSISSMIFDPLGLIGPCTITAKLIMQQLWLECLSWDESLPASINTQWLKYRKSLELLNNIKIHRQVTCENPVSLHIYGFADASKRAYGACVYILSIDKEGKRHVKLLCSKNKVSPIKTQTIPRLELCSDLLLAKLVSATEKALDININSTTYWTDSTIALGWIASEPNRLEVFEANRVAKIQELTKDRPWRHVPTDHNPADLLSRGISPKELHDNDLWWNGPSFLKEDPSKWPILPMGTAEITTSRNLVIAIKPKHSIFENAMERNSSLTRILRIVSHCIRFVNASRRMTITKGPITNKERDNSLMILAKLTQRVDFPSEIVSLAAGSKIKED